MAKDGLPANGVICGEFPAGRVPRKHQLELWRRVCAGECDVIPLTADWHFRDDIKSWSLCDLLITHQTMSATRYEHTKDHAGRSGDAWVLLCYLRSGSISTVLDDRTHARLEPGTVCVMDWSVPHVSVASDYELVTVALPRSHVTAAELMGRRTPAITWAPGSAQGRVVGNAIEHLIEQLPELGGVPGDRLHVENRAYHLCVGRPKVKLNGPGLIETDHLEIIEVVIRPLSDKLADPKDLPLRGGTLVDSEYLPGSGIGPDRLRVLRPADRRSRRSGRRRSARRC